MIYKSVPEERLSQSQSAIKEQVPHAAAVQSAYGITRVCAWRDVFQGEDSRAVSARHRFADTPIGPQYGIGIEAQSACLGGFGWQWRQAVVIKHVRPGDDRPARLQRRQPWAEQYPRLVSHDADLNVHPGGGQHGRAALTARGRIDERDDHAPDASGDECFAAWRRPAVMVARLKGHHRSCSYCLLARSGEGLRFGVGFTLADVPAFPGYLAVRAKDHTTNRRIRACSSQTQSGQS